MRIIPLTRGFTAMVDDEDFEWLSCFNWYALVGRHIRAARKSPRPEHRTVFMHRLILSTPEGLEVDHINGNTLDNRKTNLRLCLHSENCRNTSIRKDNTSGYPGVSRHHTGKWIAEISRDNVRLRKFGFTTKEAAIQQYKDWCEKQHGEFNKLHRI